MYHRFYTLAASPLRLGMARSLSGDDATQPFAASNGDLPAAPRSNVPPSLSPAPHNPRGPRGTLIGALAAVLIVALLTTGFVALFLPRLRHPIAQPTPTVAPTLTPQPTITPLPTLTPVPTITAQPVPPSNLAPVGVPVLANGTIYLTSYNGYLFALSASDGHQLWRFHADDAYAGGPPTVANGVVYFGAANACPSTGTSTPYLYAINAATGMLIWRVVGTDFPGKLLVANGVVYAGSCEGVVTAYRTTDGRQVWSKNLGSGCGTTLIGDAAHLYVNAHCVGIFALRLSDGSTQWNQPLDVSGTPLLMGSVLYVGSYALRASDGASVHIFQTSDSFGTDAIANDTVFISSTLALSAWDTTTGTRLWQIKTPDNQFHYQFIYGVENGVLYTGDTQNSLFDNGRLYAYQTANGAQLWSALINPVDTEADPPPPSLGSTLYVGTLTGSVVALNASDGTTIWTTTLR